MAKNIYDRLPVYHQIEANNLKGLQPGFVVAQMEMDPAEKSIVKDGMFENGHICEISAAGIKKYENGKTVFLHYTEPIVTYGSSIAYRFFAVEVESENPRLVQLIPGDEWMCTIDYMADPLYADLFAEGGALAGRIVKLTSDNTQSKDNWFAVEEMADGTKGYHYMFLG